MLFGYGEGRVVMIYNSIITKTERRLLEYLGQSLKNTDGHCEIPKLSAEEWERIYRLAERHEVSALMGDIFNCVNLSPKTQANLQIKTAKTVHKGIILQSLNTRLTELFEKEGITAVTLKGYAVSRFYPVPEFRKTTDIDFFFFCENDARKAEKILLNNGFKFSKEWHANHHSILISDKNETVELHTDWADDFKDKHLNKALKIKQNQSANHIVPIDCDGTKLYIYDTEYQALYLIIHMLGHFVMGGFGLRNLCDWVVLWENCDDINAKNVFLKIAHDSGIVEFSKAVTSVCTEYLGLSIEKSPFDKFTSKELSDEFLRDVLDAGEFGRSESARMVGMDGNSPLAYIREFHHQMHINFPKAGKVVLIWPALWIATLIRFLNNNRKYKRASLSAIMKKAGNRGKLVKRLTSNKKDG